MNQNNSTRNLLLRIFNNYIRKHSQKIFIAVICMIIVSATTAINAWMMQPVLDDIFINKDKSLILIIPLAILIIAIIKGISSYIQSILMSFVSYKIVADLQNHMFESLIKCDISFFSKTNSGTLISRFLADVGALSKGVHNVIINIIKDFFTLLFLIGVLFYHDPKLALISLLIFPLAIYPISRIGKRLRKISKNTQIGFGMLTKRLTESLQGIKTIKSFNAEQIEREKVDKEVENIFQLTYKSSRVNSISRPLMETLGGLAIAVIIYVGGSQVISGTTTPGTFFSFLTALLMAYQPIKSLASLNATLQMAMAAAERIFNIIDTRPLITEKGSNKDHLLKNGTAYSINFSNVSFSYENSDKTTLQNINLEIKKGEKVALVGYSGAGKTSLLNLLPRFYEIKKGKITINGINIKDLSFNFLRNHFSLVSQDIVLFDDTLKYNICYGQKNINSRRVLDACKKANCEEFIKKFPNGVNETIGEKGVKLSGGQKQRIAIARAFLKNSPFLLLDEATSSLDSRSEKKIQTSLDKLMKNKTSLVIAHRLSTIIDADKIILLQNGKIEDIDKHSNLLKKSKIYKNLYELQFKKNNDKKNTTT
jgi:subfamily B ATP-binding cassette protein MsbA|tara:strand:- start:121 stop:1905 length:1785 start_codon:yes stop_codon:yes gene_type:complete